MENPNSFRHSKFGDLPVYQGWKNVPKNLVTEIGLKERGKRRTPLQRPVAVVHMQRHRKHRRYLLYDVADAIDLRPLTARQKAALERVKVRNTCRKCGISFVKFSPEGYCRTCQREINHRREAKIEAVHSARKLINQPFLVLDTETTGLGPGDRIVEIAVIDEIGKVVFDTLINPEKYIPAGVITIHGITNTMVQGQPTFQDILPELAGVLTGKPVVVYNVGFDTRFLARGGLDIEAYDFHCAMLMYAKFFGQWSAYHNSWRRQSLEKACVHCRIQYNNMHRAVADCEATRKLLLHMARINVERWEPLLHDSGNGN